jgi:hypothetical protein
MTSPQKNTSGKIPNRIHFQSTGVKHPEYRRQLRITHGHFLECIRGEPKPGDTLWSNIGSCMGEFTAVYHTNSVEIIKHFSRVFFDGEQLNGHLKKRILDVKYYDPRGFEYIIVDRNPKPE